MEQKLYDAASKLPQTDLAFEEIKETSEKPIKITYPKRRVLALAACLFVVAFLGFGVYAYTVEWKGYSDDVTPSCPTKEEIKDITINTWTLSEELYGLEKKTSTHSVIGYELATTELTTEEIKDRLQSMSNKQTDYQVKWLSYNEQIERDDGVKCYVEKYEAGSLVWQIPFTYFMNTHTVVSDGVILKASVDEADGSSYEWLVKIDTDGNVLWKYKLDHMRSECLQKFLENADGSYTVITRGFNNHAETHLGFMQMSADGKKLFFKKSRAAGDFRVSNVVRLKDGYLLQLVFGYQKDKFVKIDFDGNVIKGFSYFYDSEDTHYRITSMIELNGKVYLSAYAVPKSSGEDKYLNLRDEMSYILQYIHDKFFGSGKVPNFKELVSPEGLIPLEEVIPMLQGRYTAMLFVCDAETGVPQQFFSVKGCRGGKLSVSESQTLLWNIENFVDFFFSPYTNSFTVIDSSCVFRYTFDADDQLIDRELTDEIVEYRW